MKSSRIEPCKNNFKIIIAFMLYFKLKCSIIKLSKKREKNNLVFARLKLKNLNPSLCKLIKNDIRNIYYLYILFKKKNVILIHLLQYQFRK